jgi:hypothetical protein
MEDLLLQKTKRLSITMNVNYRNVVVLLVGLGEHGEEPCGDFEGWVDR